MLCRLTRLPSYRLAHPRSLAIAHISTANHLTSTTMPEVTNRLPSRSPSPPAKRLRTEEAVNQSSTANLRNSSHSADHVVVSQTSSSAGPSLSELIEKEMNLPIEYPQTSSAGSRSGQGGKREIVYEDKLVLAPMVRTGSCECLGLV